MTALTDSESQTQYAAAIADANALMAASQVVSKMLAVRTIALRLIGMADAQIATELQHGWLVDAKPIFDLLAAASWQQANQNSGSIEDLQQDVWRLVLPVLDILAMLERDDKTSGSNPQSDS